MFTKPVDIPLSPTGKKVRLYLPSPENPSGETTALDIDGTPRVLSSMVLGMVTAFNRDHERREELRHDCGVFALACATGDAYEGVRFYGENGRRNKARVGEAGIFPLTSDFEEPTIAPGESLYIAPVNSTGSARDTEHHYIVRASVDSVHPPLYASKFGRLPVALHSLQTALEIYPADALYTVRFLPEAV